MDGLPESPHNLPLRLTSFLGREEAVAALHRLVSETRLITLTGPGGCGKTRLALETAAGLAQAARFPDGIWLVDLASLLDEAHLLPFLLKTLDLRLVANRPLLDALANYLQPRQVLLLLDNCEHLLPACAGLAEALLTRCPRLHLLATSREALRVGGEQLWPVPGLAVPAAAEASVAALTASAAGRLFEARARAVAPDFRLSEDNALAVSRICRRLDGLPLALELAAARARSLPVGQIAARLDDVLPLLTGGRRGAGSRHQTLEATIAWSHDLLSAAEQMLLRQLSVFAGDFALEAVEAVVDGLWPGQAEPEYAGGVAATLFQLVEKSLLQLQDASGAGGYRLLETIRQFGRARLSAAEATALATAHSRYYREMAESLAPRLYRPGRGPWLDHLERDQDNIRVALQRDLAAGRRENALRLAGALWWFWWQRGAWSEGREWLARALAGAAEDEALPATTVYGQALLGAGVLAWAQADYRAAEDYLTRCLATDPADPLTRGYARLFRSATHLGLNELTEADKEARASIEMFASAGHPAGHHLAQANAGIVALFAEDLATAEMVLEAAAAGLRQIRDDWALALPLRNLGYLAFRRGDYARAVALQRESLAVLRGQGDRWFVSRSLELLAQSTAMLGDHERAATLFGASEALREAVGATVLPYYRQPYERGTAAARQGLGEAAFAAAWARGRLLAAGAEGLLDYALAEAEGAGAGQAGAGAPVLHILALGPAEVLRDGRRLARRDWTYARPKELLFYLLCHGPRTREEIGLALWPDASPAQLRRNFHGALHRLRRALGRPDWIRYADGRYAFHRAQTCRIDLEEFEAGREEAGRVRAADPAGAVRILTEALALVRGPLLADVLADWTTPLRETWDRAVQSARLTLGEWLLADARPGEAAAVFRQAIDQDNLHEAAHRGLIRGYLQQGEAGQARRHYEALVALLADELGVAPAPETTALFAPSA